MKEQNVWTAFSGGVSALTDAAILDALFISFAWIDTEKFLSPGLPLWLLCVLICYGADLLFLRRSRSIPALALFNAILWGLSLCAVFLFSARFEGAGTAAFIVLFVLISLARGLYFALTPVRLPSLLTHVDALVLALLWLSLSCQQPLLARPGYLLLQLGIILLNLLCAVSLRVGGDGSGKVLVGAPVAGGLLCAGILGALCLSVVFLIHTFADHSRTAVQHLAHGVTAVFSALWHGLLAFMDWLFSLFPAVEPEGNELFSPANPVLPDNTVMEELEPDPRLFWILAGVAAAAAAAILLLVLFRMRRSKLTLRKIGGIDPPPAHRKKLHSGLRRRLSALWAALSFRITAFRRRNTPAGVLVRLEQRMKKAGAPRLSGETHRAFLLRISSELEQLADVLDGQYYGSKTAVLSPGECRRLRRMELTQAPQPCPASSCDSTGTDQS